MFSNYYIHITTEKTKTMNPLAKKLFFIHLFFENKQIKRHEYQTYKN
jgi:hypothetical protein